MEQTTSTPAPPSRPSASRKLLSRKAVEKAVTPVTEPLEASFPQATGTGPDSIAEPHSGSSSAPAVPPTPSPAAPAAWSSEDEAGFQALLARRKAAGYQQRGKDVSAQLLKPGAIKPNPDTVVAVIVGIVAEHGDLPRAKLLELMAKATFPHPKAQPQDKGWCQGYVAGGIRNGFLTVFAEPSAATGQEA